MPEPVILLLFALLGLGQQSARPAAPARPDAVPGIFSQVYANWRVPCETPGIGAVSVVLDITLAPDGRIVGEPRLVRPRDTPAYRAAAESALSALRESAPFNVPADFPGGEYRPTFRLDRVCGR